MPQPQGCIRREGAPKAAPEQLDRRLEEVARAVGGGYCRLQMPLKLAQGVRGTVVGHGLRAPEGWGGTSPPSNASLPSPQKPMPLPRYRARHSLINTFGDMQRRF